MTASAKCSSANNPPMAWLEVSLTVNGEAAEAVADLLTRFAPEGVALRPVGFEQSPDSEAATTSEEVVVSAYLLDGAGLDETRAQLEVSLWHLGQLLPLPAPVYRTVAESDWSESWKANFHPLRVGKRLMIVPAWLHPDLAPGDLEIRLDPGMAFGTGTHPTSRLCLETLERIFLHEAPFADPDSPIPADILDVGTGSGILAIAAAKLGARHVIAIDIDPKAVAVAEQNLELNRVQGKVAVTAVPLKEVAGPFSVVVANILAEELVRMGSELVGKLRRGGYLILSGILSENEGIVHEGFAHFPLTLVETSRQAEWSCITYRLER